MAAHRRQKQEGLTLPKKVDNSDHRTENELETAGKSNARKVQIYENILTF